MDYWNVVWLVLMLGLAVVFPAVLLVVEVRGLGTNELSEKQRRAGEEELRKAGIVREGETWEARDLDELMLNMRRYDQWKSIGINGTVLLTGGVSTVALIWAAGGMVNASVYLMPAGVLYFSSVMLGLSAGHFASDRRFAASVGAPPESHAEAIFAGVDGVLRRAWWLRVIDGGLIVAVSFCTLLYAIGKGGTLENATTSLAVARHPWLIWSTPVALCVIISVQELLVRWEMRRPPLRLTEQPELAERADLHRRQEACKTIYNMVNFQPIAWLSMDQLRTLSSLALFSYEFPLSLAAFGAWGAGIFVYGMADMRRKRQARIAAGASYEEVNGTV